MGYRKNSENKKIVVYGGSFNPPHIGHGSAIETVMRLFPCDEIWIMPSADRLDKKISTPAKERVKMLKIMIRELFPKPKTPIKISFLEIKRPKLTTTYDTKLELERLHPKLKFYFLVGSDLLKDIKNWWVNGKKLYKTANFISILKSKKSLPKKLPGHIKILAKSAVWLDISSTFMRKILSENRSGLPYIAKGVSDYIKKRKLY